MLVKLAKHNLIVLVNHLAAKVATVNLCSLSHSRNDTLDMVFQDLIGRLWHGTVIIALHLVERHVLMACQLQHAPEVGLFLITSEEFQLSVA